MQNDYTGPGACEAAIVAAETETAARLIAPDGWAPSDWKGGFAKPGGGWGWASSPESVIVKLLGEAIVGTQEGLILAKDDAG
jgi:hypothetical protein